jgi:hypothetical protein
MRYVSPVRSAPLLPPQLVDMRHAPPWVRRLIVASWATVVTCTAGPL